MTRKIFGVLLATVLAAIVGCDLTSRTSSAATATKDTSTADQAAPGAAATPVDRGGSGTADGGASTEPEPRSAQPPPASAGKTRVGVVRVEASTLEETVWTTGELRADEAVDLRAEEDGRVVALHFREGQRVAEGELLVKINDEDLQANLRRAKVQKQLAEQREQRVGSLLAERTVSQEVYDEALGDLQMVSAQIEQIEAQIRKTEIRAPFAGVIGLREVSEGGYVTTSTRIATLQRLDPVKLDFSAPEKYAGRVGPGDRVDFSVAGLDETFVGQVYAREPRIDPETRTVRLRARAANASGELLPGAFAKVRLVLDLTDGALLVPSIAVIPGNDGTTVWVVEDGVAAPRRVETGQRTEQRVEITSGLSVGEQVVVQGVQMMRPGLEVEIVEVAERSAS